MMTGHVTWGPMRGLKKKLHEKGTELERTLRLYESLGPEGRCFENDFIKLIQRTLKVKIFDFAVELYWKVKNLNFQISLN